MLSTNAQFNQLKYYNLLKKDRKCREKLDAENLES